MNQSGFNKEIKDSTGNYHGRVEKSNDSAIISCPIIQLHRPTGVNGALVGRISPRVTAPYSPSPRIIRNHARFCGNMQKTELKPPHRVYIVDPLLHKRTNEVSLSNEQDLTKGADAGSVTVSASKPHETIHPSSCLVSNEGQIQQIIDLKPINKDTFPTRLSLPELPQAKKSFVTAQEKNEKNEEIIKIQGSHLVRTIVLHPNDLFPELVPVHDQKRNVKVVTGEMKNKEEKLSDVKPGTSEQAYIKDKTSKSRRQSPVDVKLVTYNKRNTDEGNIFVFSDDEGELSTTDRPEFQKITLLSNEIEGCAMDPEEPEIAFALSEGIRSSLVDVFGKTPIACVSAKADTKCNQKKKNINCTKTVRREQPPLANEIEVCAMDPEEPVIAFALSEGIGSSLVDVFDKTPIACVSAKADTKCNQIKKNINCTKTVRREQPPLTEEEIEKRKELRRQSQYASWTWKPTVNYAELLESDVESVHSPDSDFHASSEEDESSNSSYDEKEDIFEDLEESDAELLGERRTTKPDVKDGSVFSLKLIADILETTVDQLDSNQWTEDIAEIDDRQLLKKITSLGEKMRRYKCYICSIQVHGTTENMETHMREVHKAPLGFGCFFCPLARPTEKQLLMHENVHTFGDRRGICIMCDVSHRLTKEADWTSLHAKCHPPLDVVCLWSPEEQVKVYESCHAPNCTSTRKPFGNVFHFSMHAAVYHLGGSEMCDICGENGMSRWRRTRHQIECRRKNGKTKVCKICGMKRRNLDGHNCSGKYDCKLCGAKFTSSHANSRHTRNVHGRKQYMCEQCGRAFSEKKVLEDHMNTHTGAKPYQCLACGGWYTSQAGLAMHLRSRHNLTTTQMREKYKVVPGSQLPPGETVKEEDDKIQKSVHEVNKYTGRKRGRPKVRQSDTQEEDVVLELGNDKDVVLADPTVERKSGLTKDGRKMRSKKRK